MFVRPALAFLALAAPVAVQAQASFPKGAPVTVSASNEGFAPRQIVLRQGRPYTLTLRNVSDRPHSFSARTFFGIARVDPADAGRVADNKVELAPGQVVRLRIVAPTTPNAVYEFRSLQIADAGRDMKGTILVR
ncbi:MAG: cupredoxin domain-containing protein [Sphingomonas fennica]